MIDVAVAEGYNIIVMPGYIFAPALVEVTYKYPDVKFIALDMTAGDIIAAAVGNKYYEDPDAYEASDYYNTENTYCAVYQEEIPGYMAGYAAVKLGYRNLGFWAARQCRQLCVLDSDMYRVSMMRQKSWVL